MIPYNCHSKCLWATIAWFLVIVGGLNWGLVGVGMFLSMDLNVVKLLLGSMPMVEAAVYTIVGLATLVSIIGCSCKNCKEGCGSCKVETPTQA